MTGLIQHFSTKAVPPAKRLQYWNRVAEESSSGLSVDSSNLDFSGDLQRWQLDDITIFRAHAERSVVHRAPTRRGEDQLLVHLMTRGTCAQRQAGREALLRPGDLSVCARNTSACLETTAHEILVLEVARQALESRVPDLDLHLGCPTRGSSPAAHSFAQFTMALWREAERAEGNRDPIWQRDAAEILLDLLGLALRSTERGAAPSDDQAVARMKAIIEARIAEPGLGGMMIAEELGVSVRTVQNWFSAMSTTPRAYILQRRLHRAAERLAVDPQANITVVAFDHGFNDSAYFTRCFRQAFGNTPSAWQRRARH